MNSRAYWALVLYGLFCVIMFQDYEGWMDALSTVLWLGATIYLAYNMRWSAYGEGKLVDFEPVVHRRGKKTKVTLKFVYRKNDTLQDVGFWLIWLVVLFFLNLFDLLIPAILTVAGAAIIICLFLLVAIVANMVRPLYNLLCTWLVWVRARIRYRFEKFWHGK